MDFFKQLFEQLRDPRTVKRVLWTAIQAGLATFFIGATGVLFAPNLAEAKAAAMALLAAAGAAALSAAKNAIFPPGHPLR